MSRSSTRSSRATRTAPSLPCARISRTSARASSPISRACSDACPETWRENIHIARVVSLTEHTGGIPSPYVSWSGGKPVMSTPAPARPEPPVELAITFLYYRDLPRAMAFYETVMGFELAIDQGWSKIYRIAERAHVG